MLKNSMNNFILGILTVMLGVFVIIAITAAFQQYSILIAIPIILLGFLLIGSSLLAIGEHQHLMLKCFLKNLSTNKVPNLIAKARLICFFENYDDWWKSQKELGLNSNHVSLGIFIVILAGNADKKDIISYSKHLDECLICQNYAKSWITKVIKNPLNKQSDPF